MKLHLPKLLCVAVMAAMALPAMGEGETPTYINVGQATVSNKYKDLWGGDDNNFEYTTTDGILKIGSGDKVGYFLTEGDPDSLVKTFEDAYANGNIGSAKVSNFLTILAADGKTNGDLEISGTGQVYLGGKNGKNFFSGLVANNVTIASDATGTNLWADSTGLKTFTINGGSAYLRTSWAQGNGTFGNGSTSYKSNTISSGLYINGGYLKMGRQANGSTVGAGDRNKTNEHFVNILGGEIKQTGGVAEILGKTYISASKVEQTGGQMKLAYDATAGYEFLRFGKSSTTITQNATDASTNMHIEGKIINGSAGTGNMQLNIEQKGVGTISLDNGVMFTTKDASSASNITQSGNGTINLAGDYSSALFNIDQTASGTINLKKGAVMVANTVNVGKDATLNVDGSMTFKGASSLLGTVNVGANASFTLEDLTNVKVSTTLGMQVGNTMNFNIDGLDDTDGYMQIGEGGDLAFTGGTISLSLTEATMQEMAADADYEIGTVYNITLIDNLSDADVAELSSIINDTLVLEDYYVELPVTLAETVADAITFKGEGLLVENNQLLVAVRVTNPGNIPEPTTATLSLLALAGLAARRRRR